MPKRSGAAKVVYSTTDGDLRKARGPVERARVTGDGRVRVRRETSGRVYRAFSNNWLMFLATLWAIAYIEELFWNRGVWHEHQWLFGGDWDWQTAEKEYRRAKSRAPVSNTL